MLSVDATTASYLLHCLWMLHEYKRKVGRNQMKYASLMKHGNHLYLAAYCNVYVQCECRLLVISLLSMLHKTLTNLRCAYKHGRRLLGNMNIVCVEPTG